MKTKMYMIGVVMLLATFNLLFFASCAGTRQDSTGLESDLFGEEQLENIDNDILSDLDASSDEAEVLKLLGITDDDDSQSLQQTEYSESTNVVIQTPSSNIAEQVNQLEEEVKRKEIEMSNLKSEIAERDLRLQDLQTRQTQNIATRSSSGPATGSFKDRYEDALNTYKSRNYREAIQKFDQLIAMNIVNSLIDNSQYWKGECYYALSDYNQAILEFQKVFTFGDSNKLADAQLKLGLCYLRMENRQQARSEFEKLIANYPDSEYVSRAQTYLSRL